MPGMRERFAHFYAPDEDSTATAMKTGLVVPDTNVLLGLYKVQLTARHQLFGALGKLGDRLWIPYQVGVEFHRNRLGVIAEQEAYFGKTQKEFDATIEGLCEKVKEFNGARFAMTSASVAQIEKALRTTQKLITNCVAGAEKANDVKLREHGTDEILTALETLLGDRVGDPMEPKELEDAKKEARRRVEAKEPPGYKDRDKPDPTGDYLIFKQLINEAAKRKLPVVFITDDRKEDWYRREQGLTLGARYELREQMTVGTGMPFIIMTTEAFLLHAKKYLGAEVSDTTVDQAKELPGALDESERMLAMRRHREYRQQTLVEIRMRRNLAARELSVATARVRAIRNSIALKDDDDNSTEQLKGELEARLTDRMAAEAHLTALMEEEQHAAAELAAIEKNLSA
jgi:hypothetical protein